MWRLACLFVVIGALSGFAMAEEPLAFGKEAPELSVKDIRYLPRAWKDFGDKKAIVLAFVALQDPASRELLQQLAQYRKDMSDPRVEIAMVSTGTEDSIPAIAAAAIRLDARFQVLKDREAKTARALGVKVTPTVVVVDEKHRLLYRGNLSDARVVVDGLVLGQGSGVSLVEPEGRDIVVRSAPAAGGPITYAEHVAPIINTHCIDCHRTGRAVPLTLTSYDDVASKANMIKEVALEERMPPWYASPEHQEFINANRLTQEEKDAIEQWVAGGKQPGDLTKAPAPTALPSTDWEIGEPDLVLQLPQPSEIPATGFIPYKYITLPYKFAEDTWIQGLQILPTNKAVVHHANIAYSVLEPGYDDDAQFLTGYVPGGRPVMLDGPISMLIPKNSVLTIQIHYVTPGKADTEQMKVGIRYAKSDVRKRVYFQRIRPADKDIQIAPQDPFWRISTSWTSQKNATALALFTHMHVRGRDMEFVANYPDGKEESMLLVPNYSFDWQLPYLYMPGAKQIPKGTKITTISHYDNSPFNPYNPDPNRTVPYGDQTIDEMNDAYIFYLDNDESMNLRVDPKTGQVQKANVASAK